MTTGGANFVGVIAELPMSTMATRKMNNTPGINFVAVFVGAIFCKGLIVDD